MSVSANGYRYQFTKSLTAAVKRGNLDIVRWILDHFSGCTAPLEVVEGAARFGRLEILEYFLLYCRQNARVGFERNVILWGGYDMENAIEAEHGEIARWLYTNSPDVERNLNRLMEFAVRQGDMPMIQWLLAVVYRPELHLPPPAMNHAAAGNHMDLVKWIFEQGYNGGSDLALEGAAKNGRLDMVQWLVQNGITERAEEAVHVACGEGHLSIVRWIEDRRLAPYQRFAMYNAICGCHLDIVKYLKESVIIDGPSDMIREAASSGHVHVVKWLYEEYRETNEFLFPFEVVGGGRASQTAMDRASGCGRSFTHVGISSLACYGATVSWEKQISDVFRSGIFDSGCHGAFRDHEVAS